MSPAYSENVVKKIEKAGTAFVCLACFFTPLSTSLLGLFSILAVAAWLLSGGLLDLPRVFRANPSTLTAALLFGLMAIGLTYSPVSPEKGFATLWKYRELLLMPVIFSVLSHGAKQRNGAQRAFLAGCIVLMAVSYLIFFGIIDENRYGYSLVFHITHSFFMAVLGFWALHRTASAGSPRLVRVGWGSILLAAVTNLFYVAPGRTGMFIFCCLVVLFLYQRLSLARWTAGIIVCSMLLAGAYYTSDNLSSRVQEAVDEISHYQKGQSRTSIGQRFDWWMVSLELIAEKPILGHGTGSYQQSHLRKSSGTRIAPTDNPHNEFLFLAVQFGLAGLALFLLMIALQLQESKNIGRSNRQLLQGVILALLAGSLMNSLLFDSQQGHFYLFMSAALLAGDRS